MRAAAFRRAEAQDHSRIAVLTVDLLTGPGREPSQGEQMLKWVEQNEDAWRS